MQIIQILSNHLLRRFLLLYIVFFALGVVPATLEAQPLPNRDAFVMNHLTTADGLDNMRVFSILQGTGGEMWISTRDGVNRYNGSTMVSYRLKPVSKASNAAGRIISLLRDEKGRLLAYDNKGNIYEYNEALGRFCLYYELGRHVQGDIEMNRVYSHHGLWLALRRGVYRIYNGKGSLIYGKVRANDITNTGSAIVCGLDRGLLVIDGTRRYILHGSEDYNIQTVTYDALTGYLWVGTLAHGVRIFDCFHRKWIEPKGLITIPNNPIRSFSVYDRHTMLVGIDGAGVYQVGRRNLSASLFMNAEDKTANALTGNGIYTICADRDHNIWVGSYTGGVDMASPRSINVEIYHHEYKNPESLIDNAVNAICETADGTIWFATNTGLSIYHPLSGTWQHTMHGKVIISVCPDGVSSIFAGTYGNGVYEVKSGGQVTEAFSLHKGNLKSNYISSTLKDGNGDLWIGSFEGQLTSIHQGHSTYYNIWGVQCLSHTPANDGIAAGCTNGFVIVDKAKKHVDRYFTNSEFQGKDVNTFVKSLALNPDNTAWIGTDGGGIYLYDLRRRRILKALTTAERLPSNSVAALLRDRKGNLFVSTDRGVSIIKRNLSVSNLSMIKGMDMEYNRMSCALLRDGRVAFGGNNGAVVIDNSNLNSLTNLNYKARLNINRITPAMGEDTLSDKAIEKLHHMLKDGRIYLSYSQNTFEVGFECINYRFQHDIEYEYQLEGFDEEWLFMPSLHALRYTNLPPGSYTLHIKAVSKTDGRLIDQKDLVIHVAFPWYNSPWAWLVYLLILCTLFWLLWRTYKSRLEKQYYDEKINFFVNTAHDIRTPLSLVLAPLNDLAKDENLSDKGKKFLDMARRNGDKLMKKMTQLLNFQKYDTGHMEINLQRVDFRQFLLLEMERFQPLARQKKLSLTLAECPEYEVWIDRNIMEVIIGNLVSNAVKYTPEGGSVVIYTREDDEGVSLNVRDTGIGIPNSDRKRIFRAFYRATNAMSGKETGTGLGLMITSKMAERMNAALTFESEEGKGTTFTLKPIPLAEAENNDSPTANHTQENEGETTPKDKLLFVDDNEELRHYIHLTFDTHYDIIAVESGEKAMDYLQQGGIADIVVSDVMMPGMQGTELCNLIKENAETAWMPVILLTAKSGKDFIIDGLRQGADDYVAKPFDPEILHTRIDNILKNRRRLSKYYMNKALQQVSSTHDNPESNQTETSDSLASSAADRDFIDKATRTVLDNIADEDFDINHLCREMAMSRTLFYGRLKTLTGQTPQDFIRLLRLEHASSLLKQGAPVSEAALSSGFSNAKYFATVFKKQYGISPSQVRTNVRK